MKISDLKNLKEKSVLMRVDYNVPIKNEKVEGEFRVKSSIETIKYLIENGAKEIFLVSHLGRPEKEDKSLSFKPVAYKLKELIKSKSEVKETEKNGFKAFQISDKVFLLENIRFYPQEQENNTEFAKKLASLAEIFVFEAFGVINDKASSITEVAKILPTYLGIRVEKELLELKKLVSSYEPPFVIILGGAKVSDKLPVIKGLIRIADRFLIGGAIANTFLAAKDKEIGKSSVELELLEDSLLTTDKILSNVKKDIFLPSDYVVSKNLEKPVDVKIKNRQTIELSDYIVDIGPLTISLMTKQIADAKTVFWNGNMGVSEIKEFENGTKEIAQAIAFSEAKKVAAGGDTVSFLEQQQMLEKFDFISTGGGATLSFLAGEKMPLLEILKNNLSG